MLTGIDHVVVMVSDLDRAVKDYQELGFAVRFGGRHPGGTHNALIAFADGAYIELIAFHAPSAEHRWWAALQRGGGLVDFCMGTDNLAAEMSALRQAGVPMSDPRPGSRERPDGYTVRWMLSIPPGEHAGMVPFIIQDESPRDERVPRERSHRNQVSGIGTLTVAVPDLAVVRRWLPAVLGQAGQEVVRDDLDAAGLRVTVGPHTLDYVAPRKPSGPLHDWLQARGPSPYALAFKTGSGKTRPLDEKNTHGARLFLG